jgi:hypothetical protein
MQGITFRPPRQPLVAPGAIDHHVADLTATCAADVTLDDLQRKLGEAQQWLPIDGDPRATVGTLVSTHSTGPLRLGFGAWRDLLLGVQVHLRNGELITAGARTMKNVAGYDLSKFIVGSFDRFGQLVTITIRTYRRPTHALRVEFTPSETLLGELLPTSARPQWSLLAGDQMYCGYLGDAAAIEFYQSELLHHAPASVEALSLEQDIAFRAQWWKAQRDGIRFRASVPPAKVLTFMRAIAPDATAADPAFGIVVGACSRDRMAPIRAAAKEFTGMVVYDDLEDLRTFSGADAGTVALLKRIEAAFNPA